MSENNQLSGQQATQSKGWFNRRTFIGAAAAAFAALNILVFGKRNGWWKPRLMLDIDGPFVNGEEVDLTVYERATFVHPETMSLEQRDDNVVKARVAFSMKGDKRAGKAVELTLQLFDGSGHLVGQQVVNCEDARLYQSELTVPSIEPVAMSTRNLAVFKFPATKSIQEDVKTARLKFRYI